MVPVMAEAKIPTELWGPAKADSNRWRRWAGEVAAAKVAKAVSKAGDNPVAKLARPVSRVASRAVNRAPGSPADKAVPVPVKPARAAAARAVNPAAAAAAAAGIRCN